MIRDKSLKKIMHLNELEGYLNWMILSYYQILSQKGAYHDEKIKTYMEGTVDGYVSVLKMINPVNYKDLKYTHEL